MLLNTKRLREEAWLCMSADERCIHLCYAAWGPLFNLYCLCCTDFLGLEVFNSVMISRSRILASPSGILERVWLFAIMELARRVWAYALLLDQS